MIHGEKWRIFTSDLDVLSEQSSFSELMHIKTTWGTFSSRFGEKAPMVVDETLSHTINGLLLGGEGGVVLGVASAK